jgi:hypothetical protein
VRQLPADFPAATPALRVLRGKGRAFPLLFVREICKCIQIQKTCYLQELRRNAAACGQQVFIFTGALQPWILSRHVSARDVVQSLSLRAHSQQAAFYWGATTIDSLPNVFGRDVVQSLSLRAHSQQAAFYWGASCGIYR